MSEVSYYSRGVYGFGSYQGEELMPREEPYGDLELDMIENEPPGLFPDGQDSYWGQVRKLYADHLQGNIVDLLAVWYNNLDPRTVNENDIRNWEILVGLPDFSAVRTLQQRQALVALRLLRGPFTRTFRRKIVEFFIAMTFGEAITFTSDGVALTADGVPLFSGEDSLEGTYAIVEDVENFDYQVRIKDTIAVDDSLTRELERVTPAHMDFDVVFVPVP